MHSFLAGMATVALYVTTTGAYAQQPPLFPGAEVLDTCVVDLPLTYAKKDKARYTEAARRLEDVELILLIYNKKTAKASYQRVYAVVFAGKSGEEFVYVESSEDHHSMGGTKRAIFPKYAPKTSRYYDAACFDRQLAAQSELQSTVQLAPPGQ